MMGEKVIDLDAIRRRHAIDDAAPVELRLMPLTHRDRADLLALLDEARTAGLLLLEVFDDWVIANEPLGLIGRESGRVQTARAALSPSPPDTEEQT